MVCCEPALLYLALDLDGFHVYSCIVELDVMLVVR